MEWINDFFWIYWKACLIFSAILLNIFDTSWSGSEWVNGSPLSAEFLKSWFKGILPRKFLLNLLNFLFLRADSHAQYEIRVYAEAMLDTVKKWVPITHAAFLDYRVGAVNVSAKGKKVIQKMVKGEKFDIESSGLSKREWNELMASFGFTEKIV